MKVISLVTRKTFCASYHNIPDGSKLSRLVSDEDWYGLERYEVVTGRWGPLSDPEHSLQIACMVGKSQPTTHDLTTFV